MKRNPVPGLVLDGGRESLISSAGALLIQQTIRAVGLDRCLSAALAPWLATRTRHDPGKVLLDVATRLRWVATASPMSARSAPSPSCSGRSLRTRQCRV